MYPESYPDKLPDDVLFACVKCGLCRSVCPVFDVLKTEPAVARGKLALVEKKVEGEITPRKELLKVLSLCLLCGTCQANCPMGVDYIRIMLSARKELSDISGVPITRRLILSAFHPVGWQRFLFGLGRIIQRIFLRKLPRESGLRLRFPVPFLRYHNIFPPIASRFFIPRYHGEIKAKGKERSKIGFFVGCATNYLLPEVAEKTVALLTSAGFTVVIPKDQGCCGLPAAYSGMSRFANRLVRENIATFEKTDVKTIITACATCGGALKNYYEFKNEKGEPVEVMDITEFIEKNKELFPVSPTEEDMLTTYHDPCHLKKIQGIEKEPRELLSSCLGKRFKDMKGADLCCGFGGLFSILYPEVATRINQKKMEKIIESGAQVVATACPGCIIYLREGVMRNRLPIEVKHIVEILLDHLEEKKVVTSTFSFKRDETLD
jgi:glycolate oxidase iron-sulfur subunit